MSAARAWALTTGGAVTLLIVAGFVPVPVRAACILAAVFLTFGATAAVARLPEKKSPEPNEI